MRDCRKEALPDCTFLELPKRPLSAPVDYYAPQDIERPLDHKGLISRQNSTNIQKTDFVSKSGLLRFALANVNQTGRRDVYLAFPSALFQLQNTTRPNGRKTRETTSQETRPSRPSLLTLPLFPTSFY